MEITANMIRELREKTGAGMLDCKRALQDSNGDVEKAFDFLREKGIVKAAKKSDRIAAEGIVNVVTKGNYAYIYELNSETDFVAKNEKFGSLVDLVGQVLLETKVSNETEALNTIYDGKTLGSILLEATASLGEKISLRRVNLIVKTDSEKFTVYNHQNLGKKVSLVVGSGDDEALKNVSMQVVAMSPTALSRDFVPYDKIEKETGIIRKLTEEELTEQGKPLTQLENIVKGKVSKWLKDICLLDQIYVKEPKINVGQYLGLSNTTVKSFYNLVVGEGIEKKSVDFAKEVEELTKKN